MKRRRYKLYTVLGFPLALVVILFVVGLLWLTYTESIRAINTQLMSGFQQRQTIADHVLVSTYDQVDQALRELRENLDISGGINRNEPEEVKDGLIRMADIQEALPLDIIVIVLRSGEVFVDASSPYFDLSGILPEMAMRSSGNKEQGGIVSIGDLTMLLSTEPLLDDTTGRVLGRIVGGVVLNDNLALMDEIRKRTNSQVVAFIANGELVGASSSKESEIVQSLIVGTRQATLDGADIYLDIDFMEGLVAGAIPISIGGRPSSLVLSLAASDDSLADIRQAYRINLYAVVLFALLFVLFATLLVRETTYPSLLRLMNYADKIRAEDLDANYDHGPIKEFNNIGQAMEDMVKELRKSRLLIRNIIDSMPSVLIGVDRDGNITQWNKEAEDATGFPINRAIGKPLGQVIPRLEAELAQVQQAVDSRQMQMSLKQTVMDNGQPRYEDVTIYPLIANGIEGAVIRIDNVTERISLEQMMVQTEKMMSVGGLAAGMAHEINNPLAGVIGYSHNMKKRIFGTLKKNEQVARECNVSLDDVRLYLEKREIPKMLDGVHEAGTRAASIVSNMLSFSRKSEKSFGSHNLAVLLERTLELAGNDYDLKKEYDFKKIEVVREYDPDVPDVHCERNEIQQVFLNFLKNGAQAMAVKEYGTDSPRFTLRVKRDENFVIVEVEDNGPGMREDVKKRIFEPFFTTKEVGQGTGLGLSVSYFIVADQHGGHMDVESVPNQWTRFTVKLPINDQESAHA